MSGNKTKVDVKLPSDLVIFSIFSSDTSLHFHESIVSSDTKSLNVFFR